MSWQFRSAVPSDIPLIAHSIQAHVFSPDKVRISTLVHQKLLDKTIVACVKSDPDTVIGYLSGDVELDCVHFMYVKPPFRGMGIARSLISTMFPLKHPRFATIASKRNVKSLKLVYNPFILMV